MPYDYNGAIVETDAEGYLQDIDHWTRDLAVMIAKQEDIDITDDHWEVIDFLRGYYAEHRIAPAVRALTKELKKTLGPGKGNSRYLYALFPYGPAKQACKIAGLPKPAGCI